MICMHAAILDIVIDYIILRKQQVLVRFQAGLHFILYN